MKWIAEVDCRDVFVLNVKVDQILFLTLLFLFNTTFYRTQGNETR